MTGPHATTAMHQPAYPAARSAALKVHAHFTRLSHAGTAGPVAVLPGRRDHRGVDWCGVLGQPAARRRLRSTHFAGVRHSRAGCGPLAFREAAAARDRRAGAPWPGGRASWHSPGRVGPRRRSARLGHDVGRAAKRPRHRGRRTGPARRQARAHGRLREVRQRGGARRRSGEGARPARAGAAGLSQARDVALRVRVAGRVGRFI